MGSFRAKICWGRPRKGEKKIVPMSFYPTCNRKFQKNSKQIQKIKKHHYGFSSSQNKLGKAEKERKKIVPTSSYLTCNRKLKKNSKKIQTHYCGFFPSQNMLG